MRLTCIAKTDLTLGTCVRLDATTTASGIVVVACAGTSTGRMDDFLGVVTVAGRKGESVEVAIETGEIVRVQATAGSYTVGDYITMSASTSGRVAAPGKFGIAAIGFALQTVTLTEGALLTICLAKRSGLALENGNVSAEITPPISCLATTETIAQSWVLLAGSYLNSWVDFSASAFSAYTKLACGCVCFKVAIKSGTVSTQPFPNLPVGYRPISTMSFTLNKLDGTFTSLDITSAGVMTLNLLAYNAGVFGTMYWPAEG